MIFFFFSILSFYILILWFSFFHFFDFYTFLFFWIFSTFSLFFFFNFWTFFIFLIFIFWLFVDFFLVEMKAFWSEMIQVFSSRFHSAKKKIHFTVKIKFHSHHKQKILNINWHWLVIASDFLGTVIAVYYENTFNDYINKFTGN